MSSVNKVTLLGRLGKDVELRYMTNGEAVANVSLATSESWKDKSSGEKQEKTEWHNLVFYRKLAEIAGEYLKKGSQIYVEGKIQTRKYEKDGVERYTTEIIVNEMTMLGGNGKGEGASHDQPAQAAPQKAAAAPKKSNPPPPSMDDDIPFEQVSKLELLLV